MIKKSPEENELTAGQCLPAPVCCAPPELQELCDLITGQEGTSFKEAKEALKLMLSYRMSKRIRFITDKWGGRDETHFELDALGLGLQITITADNIHVVGQGCFEVDKHSANAMDVTRRDFSRHNV
jgi:hypothetical protein